MPLKWGFFGYIYMSFWEYFDDHPAELEPANNSLGVTLYSYIHECVIELTINPPRIAKYKRLSYDDKVLYIECQYEYVLAGFIDKITKKAHTIEKCKDGYPHLHSQIFMKFDTHGDVNGLVCDIAYRYIRRLTWRYEKEHSQEWRYMNYDYNRWRCPSVTVQYRKIEELARHEMWDNYINKCVKNAPIL